MPDVQILAPGTHPSPLDYVVPGAQEILIKAIAASYDGTSAGGSFVPCLQLIAPGGVLAATCPLGATVAAGSSADVSWFPRGGAVNAGNSGAGIQFNTDNEGGWLDITTNDGDPDGWGFQFTENSGNGMYFDAKHSPFEILSGFLQAQARDGLHLIDTSTSGTALTEQGNSDVDISSIGGGNLNLTTASATGAILVENSSGSATGDLKLNQQGTGKLHLQNSGSGPTTIDHFGSAEIQIVHNHANGIIRVETTQATGQIFIDNSSGAGIFLSGGHPIVLTANTGGGAGTATIVFQVDATDRLSVTNIAASAEYFTVKAGGRVSMQHLPTSAAGLSAGDLWNNANVVNIV